MSRKLSLTAVLLVLAVGLAVPAAPAGAEEPQPTYVQGITFGAPVRMNYTDPAQIGGPGEPSIKVDAAGTIYVAGVCCIVRAAPAWYSRDGGQTFRYLPSPAGAREHGLGAEGDFALDDADGVFFVDTYIPSLFFTKWSGHGDVWEYTEPSETVVPGVNDRPWLAYSNGAVYLYVNHVTHVAVWKSTDGMHTWTQAFSTLGQGQRYWTGHVAAHRGGKDVYLFGRNCTTGSDYCAASSHDAGATWTQTAAGTNTRGGSGGIMVAADVDQGGNVYGTFTTSDTNGCDVYLTASSDGGATWRQFKVNAQPGCSTFPWVAAGSDGRVTVSWYHNPTNRSENNMPANSEWRVQAAVVEDATSDTPTVTWGTLDHVIHRGNLGRALWDYQQIAIGPDGRFHIALAEDALAPCTGNLSTWGGAIGYRNKCTTYVGQAGGPRAVPHAADQTTIDAAQVTGGAGTIQVAGATTFARQAPVKVIDDPQETLPAGDITTGTITRHTALSDELVFDLTVRTLSEGASSPATYVRWPFTAGGQAYQLNMQGNPRVFQVCQGAVCTPVRGDVDPGGDRLVARVPVAAIGLTAGGVIEPQSVVRAYVGVFGGGGVSPDPATQTPYTVPGASVRVSVKDASDQEVAAADGTLSPDISAFQASLSGLAAGTYTVTTTACYAEACATASQPGVVVS